MSIKFVSAILGPEMAAPILRTPGKMRSFCRKTCVHKIPRFRGGVIWVWGGGGKCRFYFYGRADFSETIQLNVFQTQVFWKALRVMGRPHLRIVDVRTEMLVFPRFGGPTARLPLSRYKA